LYSDGPVTVYIVDDDAAVREGFSRLLRSAGLVALPYPDAASFLRDVKDLDDGCVLLDITMPGMGGPAVQTALNHRGIRMPVITVSGREDEQTRKAAHGLGARMFLRKPVDAQALLDAIEWVTGTPPPAEEES
jgi:two-component system response regulator FixJ